MDTAITLAGMVLDKPFEPGAVLVPSKVKLEGDRLLWAFQKQAYKRPPASVLDKFRRLHSAPAEKVLAFVKEFGPACLCEQHRLPVSHAYISFGGWPMEHCGLERSDTWFVERIEDYRRFSLAADSIIQAAAMVNTGQVPGPEIFGRFRYWTLTDSGKRAPQERLRRSRNHIASEVDTWIAVSKNHPQLQWLPKRKVWHQTVAPHTWGVLGPVAMALFTTVPLSPGWLICAICGDTYQPKRPARPGRNHYCPDCRGSAEMWRALKQQQRAK